MDQIAEKIIEMEKSALERWGKGDPGGFLEINAEDIVYFDPYIPRRIDGLKALTDYYRGIWGQIHVDRFELLNPDVNIVGDLALLTFNYVSYTYNEPDRWNCTEVFQHFSDGQWKIIQSHWSYTEVFKHKMVEKKG